MSSLGALALVCGLGVLSAMAAEQVFSGRVFSASGGPLADAKVYGLTSSLSYELMSRS